MKLLVCLLLLFVATVTADTAVTQQAVSIADSSITADTLVNNVSSMIGAIKGLKAGTVTILLLVAAIIKLLISLMKFPPVAGLLDSTKMKPLKPYIAILLGILGGFVASLTTGQSLLVSILSGLTVGFGSIGIHETLKSLTNKNS